VRTAGITKGRTKKYPYYFCVSRECPTYGKSIHRDVIEGHFAELVKALQPTTALFSVAFDMFKALWNHRLRWTETRTSALKTELTKIQKQADQFLDRIAETNVPSVVAAYETRIRDLETQRLVVTEKLAASNRPRKSFDEPHRTALQFLASPSKLWSSERLED
jgi:septal ring factor EnvC (AmiA/AmiB activator)